MADGAPKDPERRPLGQEIAGVIGLIAVVIGLVLFFGLMFWPRAFGR
jgi:hypothetical protein